MPVVKIDPGQAPCWRLGWGAGIASAQAIRITLVDGGCALGHREGRPILFKNLAESFELSFKAFARCTGGYSPGNDTRSENGGWSRK